MKRRKDRGRTEGGRMRLAVISDVHGNSAALDAVLADAERLNVDQVVNLGDSLSGPLDPAGYVPIDYPLPLAIDALLPRGVAQADVRERSGCYAYVFQGTLYPVRRPDGGQYCIG